MPIVSSVIVDNALQKDGRRWIREHHTDHVGVVRAVQYLAAAGFNTATAMAARVAVLDAEMTQNEIATNIAGILIDGRNAPVSLVYSTVAQNRAALRAAYQLASRVEAIMIADFLASLTDAQLASLFGMTAAQVTTLKTNKLTPAATAAATIRASTGA